MLLFLCLGLAAPARAATATEYELKATFLFNFIMFTGWPTEAMPAEGRPLVIGILGEDPFGPLLDQLVEHETIQGHPITVQRYRSGQKTTGCHVLYISRSESANLPAILRQIHGQPVLTVSDIDRFATLGGMIGLVVEQGRVRVQVNLDSTVATHLVLSAKLLRLAHIVRDGPQSRLFPVPGPGVDLQQFLADFPVRVRPTRRFPV